MELVPFELSDLESKFSTLQVLSVHSSSHILQGFLPEAYDDFAVKYVFPAFTPTLGIFLAISIVYGLLKV